MASAARAETIDADDTLVFLERPGRRWFLRGVSAVSLTVYAIYLVYRAFYTLNPEAPVFSALVYFAELHGFVSLLLFYHQVWGLRGRRVVPPAPDRRVDIFITTYNEDVDLLRQTARAAVAVRYPHRTYLLDDGRRPAVRALAEELGCEYVTREDNTHAKAGNWNNAFRLTDAEFIATFDADHVPSPEFLERTLGFFRDPRVALVQVPQQYHNLDSVQHRVSWRAKRMYSEQDAFFNLVMPGKDHWNAAFFCGTGAVLRREALAPHGGILTGTITEDLHTSIVLHAEGWKSVYLNEVLVTGLAPMDLKSFEVQRLRWAEGNLRVAGLVNPVTVPGLTPAQRISYVASLYHWTIGVPKLIYYLAPPWMLLSGTFPIANFDVSFLLLYLGFLTSLVTAYSLVSRGTGRLLMDELFNMVSFFTLLTALKRVIVGRRKPARFEVTSKRGSQARGRSPVLPHVVLLVVSLLAIQWALMGYGFAVRADGLGVGMGVFWTVYNMALMLAAIRIGTRPAEKRQGVRFHARFAVEVSTTEGTTLGVTTDLSDSGCALLWPTPLVAGATLPMVVHFGARRGEWTGKVQAVKGVQRDGWYLHGVQFVDLTQADIDLINDSVFSLVVPELFTTLIQPSWLAQGWRALRRRLGRPVPRAVREPVRVPVRVGDGPSGFVGTALDVSRSGVGVVAPRPLTIGSQVALAILGPTNEWRGHVEVARCEARPSRAGFDNWLLGLRFVTAADQADAERFQRPEAA